MYVQPVHSTKLSTLKVKATNYESKRIQKDYAKIVSEGSERETPKSDLSALAWYETNVNL